MRVLWRTRVGIGLMLAFFAVSCSRTPPPPPPVPSPPVPGLRTQRPYQISGIWYYPLPSAEGYIEEGIASWYGSDFHGRPTSCGEPYDMYAMTAAHKTLPLGTYVKVTNLENQRSTILRINDRGPFVAGRIIDLSCRGAQELGSYRRGTAKVRVEAVQHASEEKVGQNVYWKVDPIPSFRYGQFTIQVGAFREQPNALKLKDKMARSFQWTQVGQAYEKGCILYRVQVGMYQDLFLAKKELDNLRIHGFSDAFIVAVEGK